MKRILNADGFSLAELMMVTAIIGILAAVATPAYVNHVYRTRESIAHQYILDVQAAQERFYALNDSYATNAADAELLGLLSFDTADTQVHIFTLVAATTNTYTAQVASDINQDGVYSNCWRIQAPPADPILQAAAPCDNAENFSLSLIGGIL